MVGSPEPPQQRSLDVHQADGGGRRVRCSARGARQPWCRRFVGRCELPHRRSRGLARHEWRCDRRQHLLPAQIHEPVGGYLHAPRLSRRLGGRQGRPRSRVGSSEERSGRCQDDSARARSNRACRAPRCRYGCLPGGDLQTNDRRRLPRLPTRQSRVGARAVSRPRVLEARAGLPADRAVTAT
jgi:hypothetical protein